MLTRDGHSVYDLLANVTVRDGELTVRLVISEDIKEFDFSNQSAMVNHINDRIDTEKKPSATYSKVLQQIDDTAGYLVELYTKLFETYQRAIDETPKVRMSPKDKAMADMLGSMPDKMLREFTALQLGDKASDFVLPDERDQLIAAYVAIGKNGTDSVVKE